MGQLVINSQTFQQGFKISTCTSPISVSIIRNLDIIFVVCLKPSFMIFKRSTGEQVSSYSFQRSIDQIIYINYLNIAYILLTCCQPSQTSSQFLKINLSQLTYIQDNLNEERNVFIFNSFAYDFPFKVYYFYSKFNSVYQYNTQNQLLSPTIFLPQNVRKLYKIKDDYCIAETSQYIIVFDRLKQIHILTLSIDSHVLEILNFIYDGVTLSMDLYLIKKPNQFSHVNIYLDSTGKQFQTLVSSFISNGILINILKTPSFLLITQNNGYLLLFSLKQEQIELIQLTNLSKSYELQIIQDLNFTVKQSIWFVAFLKDKSISFLEILWSLSANNRYNYNLNKKLITVLPQIVSQAILDTNTQTTILQLVDHSTIYEYHLKAIYDQQSTQIIKKYQVPFSRERINIIIYNNYGYILTYCEFSFSFFNRTTTTSIFYVKDDQFVNNNILDMVMLSQNVALITQKFNLVLVTIDFDSFQQSGTSYIKQIFKSDQEQIKLIDSYLIQTRNNQIFKLIGYNLKLNEIVDLNIPMNSTSCVIEINNPNYFLVKQQLSNLNFLLTQSIAIPQSIKLQLEMNSFDLYYQVISFIDLNITTDLSLSITGSEVVLDQLDLHNSNGVFKSIYFEQSTIYLCNQSKFSQFKVISFHNSNFKFGYCNNQLDQQFTSHIQIKNVETVLIQNCIVNSQLFEKDLTIFEITQFTKVEVQELEVSSNKFNVAQLLQFQNGQQIIISKVQIQQNSFTYNKDSQLITAQKIDFIQINGIKIFNNQQNLNMIQLFTLKIKGVTRLIIQDLEFQQNQQIGLLDSDTRFLEVQNNISQIIISQNSEIQFNNVNVIDNRLNNNPIFSFKYTNKIFISQSQFIKNYLLAELSSFLFVSELLLQDNQMINNTANSLIVLQDTNQFQISNIVASNNTSLNNGGVLSIINSVIPTDQSTKNIITDSMFSSNTAQFEGGAIYSKNSNFNLFKIIFKQNQALIGGAIRYEGLQPIFVNKKRNLKILKKAGNQFLQNQGFFFGKNIGSNNFIAVIDSRNKVEKLQLQNVQSGQELNEENIYLIDQDYDIVNLNYIISQNYLIPSKIQNLIDSLIIEAKSSNQQQLEVKGTTIIHYNPQFNVFNLKGMKLSGIPGSSTNSLVLSFPFIANYDNLGFESFGSNFNVKIQFRECLIGEIYTKISNTISECFECRDNRYSLIQPIKDQNQVCKQCNQEGALSCQKNEIELKQGYWRKNTLTDDIIYCFNSPSSCNGDIKHKYCAKGYIGPLCETCDYEGIEWGEIYGRTIGFQCSPCTNIFIMILRQLAIVIIILCHLTYSIKSANDKANKLIICQFLRRLDWVILGKSGQNFESSTYIKFFMNFIQIVSVFEIKEINYFSQSFRYFQDIIGNPTQGLSNSLDCLIKSLSDTPIQYTRVAWISLLPFFIMAIGLILYLIYLLISHSNQFKKKYFYSSLSFGILYFQSGVLSHIIYLVSCQKIGDTSYIAGQLDQECYTTEHVFYLIVLILPLFIFWMIIAPLIMFIILYRARNNLDSPFVLQKYGIYFYEYKKKYYYWEFVRMIVRVLIILIGNILSNQSQIFLKQSCILFIILIYGIIVLQVKPYQIINQNQFDFKLSLGQIFIASVWALCISTNSPTQNQICKILFFSTLLLFYGMFIVKIFILAFNFNFILRILNPKQFRTQPQNKLRRFILWKRLRSIMQTSQLAQTNREDRLIEKSDYQFRTQSHSFYTLRKNDQFYQQNISSIMPILSSARNNKTRIQSSTQCVGKFQITNYQSQNQY